MRMKSHVRALRFSLCLSTNIDAFSFKLQIQQLVRKLKFKKNLKVLLFELVSLDEEGEF